MLCDSSYHCFSLCESISIFWTFCVAASELSGRFFHDFIVEVDILDSRFHFALFLLDICIAGCSFLLYCASPRTSPCLGRRPLVCVCLLLALLLALLLCLLLALLLSVLYIIAPDFSCSSRCPRTRVALLHSCRHRLVGCGSVSDSHRSLAAVPSVLLSHHWLFGCGSVFWLVSGFPPKITTQHCALRD